MKINRPGRATVYGELVSCKKVCINTDTNRNSHTSLANPKPQRKISTGNAGCSRHCFRRLGSKCTSIYGVYDQAIEHGVSPLQVKRESRISSRSHFKLNMPGEHIPSEPRPFRVQKVAECYSYENVANHTQAICKACENSNLERPKRKYIPVRVSGEIRPSGQHRARELKRGARTHALI